jgi:NAD(P)-dependent dehydrogenase (short-subunit alcohol dehydrogenase family)
VKGVLFTVQKALPLINDGGSIILTGSVGSVKGTPGLWVYGATKAAIRNFVRAWTVELKDRRIRSNVLSPGPTETPIIDQQPPDAIARIVSTIPMGRMGSSEEIAKAALFLASDDSSFVTGIELFVDGGRAQIRSMMKYDRRLQNSDLRMRFVQAAIMKRKCENAQG